MMPSAVADLTRLSLVGMMSLAMTLGYVSVAGAHSSSSIDTLVVLLLIGLFFHVAVFVHNDLCDLEIDRTEPRRQRFPLVTGAVTPRQAWAVVGLCVVATYTVDAVAFGPNLQAVLALLAACAGIGIYNVFGKRVYWPYVTDFVQGAGWAALILYAALRTSAPSALTWLVALYYAVYIAFVSGVHGALRDLTNDFACGARTTAIVLGARPAPGGPVMSQPLVQYSLALQVVMTALALAAVPFFDFRRADGYVVTLGMIIFSALAFLLLFRAFEIDHDQDRLDLTGALQMIFAYAPAVGLAAGRSRWPVAILTLAVMAIPLAGNARFRYAVRHLGQLVRGQGI